MSPVRLMLVRRFPPLCRNPSDVSDVSSIDVEQNTKELTHRHTTAKLFPSLQTSQTNSNMGKKRKINEGLPQSPIN